MSAYGTITRATSLTPLHPRSYLLPSTPALASPALTLFPLTRTTVDPSLLSYLTSVFNAVVAEGRTYPQQEQLTVEEFVRSFPCPLQRCG